MDQSQYNPKILIVDDKPENLYSLEKLLAKLPVEVLQALSGFEAMELTLKHDFAAAIVDVQMPEMDGYELVEFLRNHRSTQSLPVIFVSAIFSDEYHHHKGYDAGAVDFISKPFNPDILLSKVKVFLELYGQRAQLEAANRQINSLNQQLEAENLRMRAELDVVRRLQQLILPRQEEFQDLEQLDIVGFMDPADEVGGDYYDILGDNGTVNIGIGDVTGHGLESGMLMLMTHTVIRTLVERGETDLSVFLNVLNGVLYKDIQRMKVDKMLTFALVSYQDKLLKIAGQHEEILVVRQNGQVEQVDTADLGFPLGLEADIAGHIAETTISLEPGDGIVLYTDGITEAENIDREMYGLERLCRVVSCHWGKSVEEIKQAVTDDVLQFIGEQKIYDDLTLVVLKQK